MRLSSDGYRLRVVGGWYEREPWTYRNRGGYHVGRGLGWGWEMRYMKRKGKWGPVPQEWRSQSGQTEEVGKEERR